MIVRSPYTPNFIYLRGTTYVGIDFKIILVIIYPVALCACGVSVAAANVDSISCELLSMLAFSSDHSGKTLLYFSTVPDRLLDKEPMSINFWGNIDCSSCRGIAGLRLVTAAKKVFRVQSLGFRVQGLGFRV